MIRQAAINIGAELREIDDFCREHPSEKLKWYAAVETGSDQLLAGLREWGLLEN